MRTGGERHGEGEESVAGVGGTSVVRRPRRQPVFLNELADHVTTHTRTRARDSHHMATFGPELIKSYFQPRLTQEKAFKCKPVTSPGDRCVVTFVAN